MMMMMIMIIIIMSSNSLFTCRKSGKIKNILKQISENLED